MTSEPAEIGKPLLGRRIALTASRRADELEALLVRRGAVVVGAPAVRMAPIEQDADLLAVTKDGVDRPPDVVVATAGVGFRMWGSSMPTVGVSTRLS